MSVRWVALCGMLLGGGATYGQTGVPDWLPPPVREETAPAPAATPDLTGHNLQGFVELGFSRSGNRVPQDNLNWAYTANLGLDLRLQQPLRERLDGVFSNRLDADWQRGEPLTENSLTNTLREIYLSYRPTDTLFTDLGRINIRHGVAVNYSPTDYFRTNALVLPRSLNPTDLRNNRLGVLAAQFRYLSVGQSLGLVLVPEVNVLEGDGPFNPRLQQTNNANKWLLEFNPSLVEGLFSGFNLFRQGDGGVQAGINLSHSFGLATVGYLEWSGGRAQSLGRQVLGSATTNAAVLDDDPGQRFRNEFALGATYTTPIRLNISLEYDYNGAGFSSGGWQQFRRESQPTPSQDFIAILSGAARLQEPVTRQAWFARLNWPEFPVYEGELTAIAHYNPFDQSRLIYVEWNYSLPKLTFSVRFTSSNGRSDSEYGSIGTDHVWTAVVKLFF